MLELLLVCTFLVFASVVFYYSSSKLRALSRDGRTPSNSVIETADRVYDELSLLPAEIYVVDEADTDADLSAIEVLPGFRSRAIYIQEPFVEAASADELAVALTIAERNYQYQPLKRFYVGFGILVSILLFLIFGGLPDVVYVVGPMLVMLTAGYIFYYNRQSTYKADQFAAEQYGVETVIDTLSTHEELIDTKESNQFVSLTPTVATRIEKLRAAADA